MSRRSTLWHNAAMRAAAAVADGWREYDEVYRVAEWSPQALAAVREQRLAGALADARHAPYYADLLDGDTDDALAGLPVLDKEVLVKCPEKLRTGLVDPLDVIRTRTSGTTGEPVVIEHDERRLSAAFASQLRLLAAYGVEPPVRSVRFTADQRHPLVDFLHQPVGGLDLSLRVNAAKIDASNAQSVFDLCRDFAPTVVAGQPLEVLLGCTAAAEHGRRLPAVRLVLTHGDTLDELTTTAVRAALDAPHCDVYGLQELGKVAWSCPSVPGNYHLDEEKVRCEVDGDGLLLFTSLVNRATALLRYRPGDGADRPPGPCPCGRATAVLRGLRGRQRGFVLDRDSRPRAIKAIRLYLESCSLARWQFVQDEPGVAVVRVAGDLDADRAAEIGARVREIGELSDVRIDSVDLAQLLTATGKAPHFRLLVDQRGLATALSGR